MAVYDDVKRALQDIMAPQLAELRADMDARFAQMDARFSELRSEMNSRFAEVRQEINNLHTDLVRIEQVFDARLQTVGVLERVARLEERLARS